MSELFDATLQAVSLGMDMRAKRQGILLSNVANLDTPNYVPRDLEFSDMLARATERADASGLVRTSDNHLTGTEATLPGEEASVEERPDRAVGPDGNAVDLDKQLAISAENTMLYAALTRAAGKKIGLLKHVLSSS